MHLEYVGSIRNQWGPCEILQPGDEKYPDWPNVYMQGRYVILSHEGHRLVHTRPESIWIVND